MGAVRREPPLPVTDESSSVNAAFLEHMAAHHRVGVVVARLAARRANHPELRALGRLMVAEQQAEIAAMERWWHACMGGG